MKNTELISKGINLANTSNLSAIDVGDIAVCLFAILFFYALYGVAEGLREALREKVKSFFKARKK